MLSLSQPNVIIEAVKPAEDGSGDIIVRLYESMRTACRCTLDVALPLRKAAEADMLEEPRKAVKLSAGKIDLTFRPFEIKTIRLSM